VAREASVFQAGEGERERVGVLAWWLTITHSFR
jgi:hypothetical protein